MGMENSYLPTSAHGGDAVGEPAGGLLDGRPGDLSPLAVSTGRGAAPATMGRFGLWSGRIERYLNLRLRG
jgi:hypothetical protein